MRIGLDIDNVISNFDKGIAEECSKYDKTLRNNGIVHPNERHVSLLYDWSNEERENFFIKNMERIAQSLEPRKGAKEYMERLLAEGHSLYLITNRVYPHYKNPYETTLNWLQDKQIPYTELIIAPSLDKSEICIQKHIDIMFDDSIHNCEYLKRAKIPFYMVCTDLNYPHRGDLPYVCNWKELYEKTHNMVS